METVWEDDVPYLTPNDRFFVRNHTRPPSIDAASWRLLVTGDGVVGEATYSLAELQSFTNRTYERALECTGNGRRLFADQQGHAAAGHPVGHSARSASPAGRACHSRRCSGTPGCATRRSR